MLDMKPTHVRKKYQKLRRFIFAIALSEHYLLGLRQFLAHIYFNKFPIIIRGGEPARVLKVQRAFYTNSPKSKNITKQVTVTC